MSTAKALRLSLLGWTQAEIGERLGVDQSAVSLDMKNFNNEDFHIFTSGHPIDEIGERLGVTDRTVRDETGKNFNAELFSSGHPIDEIARRLCLPIQASILRGRRYNRMKKAQGGDRKSSGQNVHLKTAEQLAKQHGVAAATGRQVLKMNT